MCSHVKDRAQIHVIHAASLFPVVDCRRWGRNIESAGEDPFLSGQYAKNFVQGFEHAKEASYPLQVCRGRIFAITAWHGSHLH